MARRTKTARERAARQVMPLRLALYHDAHDARGGVPCIAATYGGSESLLHKNLNPNEAGRYPSLRQFEQIFEYAVANGSGDRIRDALAAIGGFVWLPLPGRGEASASVIAGVGRLSTKVAGLVHTISDALADGRVCADEAAELELALTRMYQAGIALVDAAKREGLRHE